PGLREDADHVASRVAEKARDQQSVAGAVHVFITTSPFRKNDRQHSASVTVPLVRPTADTRLLIGAAVRALRGMYRPGFNYVKAGVMLVDLQPEGQGPARASAAAIRRSRSGGRRATQRASTRFR